MKECISTSIHTLKLVYIQYYNVTMSRHGVSGYVKEWGSMSSMHGIPWLVTARTGKARIFWTIICVLSMVMFITMLSSLVVKYYQYPVAVQVDQVSANLCYFCLCTHTLRLTASCRGNTLIPILLALRDAQNQPNNSLHTVRFLAS